MNSVPPVTPAMLMLTEEMQLLSTLKIQETQFVV